MRDEWWSGHGRDQGHDRVEHSQWRPRRPSERDDLYHNDDWRRYAGSESFRRESDAHPSWDHPERQWRAERAFDPSSGQTFGERWYPAEYGRARSVEASGSAQQADYRGRGPKGYARSDQRIREDVCERLSDDAAVDASEITVLVSAGEVTLEGHVETRRMKRRAEALADSVRGIRDVHNHLRVRKSLLDRMADRVEELGSAARAETTGREAAQVVRPGSSAARS